MCDCADQLQRKRQHGDSMALFVEAKHMYAKEKQNVTGL